MEYKKQDWTQVTDAKVVSGLDTESASPKLWAESGIYLSSRIWETKYFDCKHTKNCRSPGCDVV